MFKRTLLATLTAAACLPAVASAAQELPPSYQFGMHNGNTAAPPVAACPAGDVMVVGGGRYHEAELNGFGVVTGFSAKNIGAPGAKLSMHMLRSDRTNPTAVGFKVLATVPVTLDGTGSFDVPARIPVENGDRIALSKAAGAQVACAFPQSMGEFPVGVGIAEGKFANGASVPWKNLNDHELLAGASLEIDADGDGWGDVSQDRCDDESGKHQGCTVIKPKCKVPGVVGLTGFVAKQKITKAGCKVGTVKTKTGLVGTPVVQSQSKKARTKVKSGTKIDLVLGDRG